MRVISLYPIVLYRQYSSMKIYCIQATTDTDYHEHIGREFIVNDDEVHENCDDNDDDSGYFSDGELSSTDLEEVDDDNFFRALERRE